MIQLALLRITESYFRHRWLYLLPVVMMIVVAAVYPSTVSSTYIARGTIYIQKETLLSSLTALQNDGFGWVTPAKATAGELNELFGTEAFVRAVAEQSELESEMSTDPEAVNRVIGLVRDSIWVYPLGNTLVQIGATNESPRIAYQLSSAIIETYIQWKINLGREESVAAQDFFVQLIDSYQSELEPVQQDLTNYLIAHPQPLRGERPAEEAAEIARLQAAVDQAFERLRSAEGKEENARLALVQTESDVRQTYFTVDEPAIPISPEKSMRDIALVMALCVASGVFMSMLAIVGGALIDRSFRFPIDIRHGLNLPVLALVAEVQLDEDMAQVNAPAPTAEAAHNRSAVAHKQGLGRKRASGSSGLIRPQRRRQSIG